MGIGPETRKETLREGVRKRSKECTEARNVLWRENGERWRGTREEGQGKTKEDQPKLSMSEDAREERCYSVL